MAEGDKALACLPNIHCLLEDFLPARQEVIRAMG